jgi:hypothetical protein
MAVMLDAAADSRIGDMRNDDWRREFGRHIGDSCTGFWLVWCDFNAVSDCM